MRHNCSVCGRSTIGSGWGVSFGLICDECAAEERRRKDARLCLECGTQGLSQNHYWCDECWTATGIEYRGYPGQPHTMATVASRGEAV